MARLGSPMERWLWYAPRTSRCVPLDPKAYPSTFFIRALSPFPDWACKAPDGGLHINRKVGRIDIEAASAPTPRIELNWTCDYGVRVISRSWLADIEDLIDGSRVFVGEVRRGGRRLESWATIHEALAPPLLSTRSWSKTCPICGDYYRPLVGRIFFGDPGVIGRPLIVNRNGLFVREDLALSRNLRKPVGAFKPAVVRFDPRAVAGDDPRPHWAN